MIQFVGLQSLELPAVEVASLQHTIERYGLHSMRHFPDSEVQVHVKALKAQLGIKNRSYTVKVRFAHSGHAISVSVDAWDVRAAVHKAFQIVEEKLYGRSQEHKHFKSSLELSAVA